MNDGTDTRTNQEVIRDYLKDHPNADKAEIAMATGRKIHSPDLAKVRKKMGITFNRRGRRPKQASPVNGKVPVVTPTVQMDGLTLYTTVIELARLHGLTRVKAACDNLASVGS